MHKISIPLLKSLKVELDTLHLLGEFLVLHDKVSFTFFLLTPEGGAAARVATAAERAEE